MPSRLQAVLAQWNLSCTFEAIAVSVPAAAWDNVELAYWTHDHYLVPHCVWQSQVYESSDSKASLTARDSSAVVCGGGYDPTACQRALLYLGEPRPDDPIEDILAKHHGKGSSMMLDTEARFVLRNLQKVLQEKVPGDIIEMGCHEGGTSVLIQELLVHMQSTKILHVYDSWQGIPAPCIQDQPTHFREGDCLTRRETFVERFNRSGLTTPVTLSPPVAY